MSERAVCYAKRFRQQNTEVIAFAEGLRDDQWMVLVPEEQRSVGILLHHIAMAYRMHRLVVQAMASGSDLPEAFQWDAIHNLNARHAEKFAQVSRDEVAAALRRYGDRLAVLLEQLDDDQLQRRSHVGILGAEATTESVIDRVVLGHPQDHLSGIREALSKESAAA